MKALVWMVAAATLTVGCAGGRTSQVQTLRAPVGTAAVIGQQLEEGNQLFAQADWEGAKRVYLATIQADPALAEAHYNLALVLERQGDKVEARKHYVAAANLAPGNKVIWNAPPLRKYDGDLELKKKSFMDASPR
ncbi:tetratricopeptide repeat protein [Nitrospirales bacterium NOB]|nr:MAG: Tetratricopeptide repeat protein [Nitrospira sp. OLB3]MCE7965717.1 tetratricopeptide repeat protein [Nitrospira sp. NTP2]MCK6493106.1 tetratricopeptide repeat protein [Nitrospira sp.]MDL1888521.1 tetratricopeptide repeat protein [Nitrospirales bacterium NOB]MEB2340183.1 tetratricopeptide repeat protein [Nitrospirales bacterium]